jgi:hypothetical protein
MGLNSVLRKFTREDSKYEKLLCGETEGGWIARMDFNEDGSLILTSYIGDIEDIVKFDPFRNQKESGLSGMVYTLLDENTLLYTQPTGKQEEIKLSAESCPRKTGLV